MPEEKKHISQDTLEALGKHTLSKEETLSVLEHISSCTYCAEVYATMVENHYSVTPSPDLKENILKRARTLRFRKKHSQKAELLFYSLRVGIAMSFALLILYSVPFQDLSQNNKKTDFIVDHSIFTTINQNINHFTTKIMHLEGYHNEKTEK